MLNCAVFKFDKFFCLTTLCPETTLKDYNINRTEK